ncbi:unnamed protein product [Meloidogyne enterolobii]|uniref:Uncharacterized protein n=1 Tax=Meloidogyne enterolobii TaxID=390850 RepID=A0ACB0ZHT3_MELEN
MFSSSTKICLFFLSIFVLFELNNACAGYGATCSGKGQGNCCGGTCYNRKCCIASGGTCTGNANKCCPGTGCQPPGEVGHEYRCM